MGVNAQAQGTVYEPDEVYEVGREKVREFARAVGETNPVCHDRDAAIAAGYAEQIAPPTFAIVITGQADTRAIMDPNLGLDFSRVVHGEQSFTHERPLMAGDAVSTRTTISRIRQVAGNAMVTFIDEIFDVQGELVCTGTTMLVVRGQEQE